MTAPHIKFLLQKRTNLITTLCDSFTQGTLKLGYATPHEEIKKFRKALHILCDPCLYGTPAEKIFWLADYLEEITDACTYLCRTPFYQDIIDKRKKLITALRTTLPKLSQKMEHTITTTAGMSRDKTPYQTAISALETLKDLLTPTVADTAIRADIAAAESRLAALRTRPASVENCDAIAGEQQLIDALRHKLATTQGSAQLSTALHILEHAAAVLPGGPAAPAPIPAAPSAGLFSTTPNH